MAWCYQAINDNITNAHNPKNKTQHKKNFVHISRDMLYVNLFTAEGHAQHGLLPLS